MTDTDLDPVVEIGAIELRPHDVFRASGGPRFKGEPAGDPGLYRLIAYVPMGDRLYAEAVPVDSHGVQNGGTKLLYLKGDEFTRDDMPGWLYRPYVIKATRSEMKVDGKTGKTVVASIKSSRAKTSKVKQPKPTPASAPTPSPIQRPSKPMDGSVKPIAASETPKADRPAATPRASGGMSILDAAAEILKRAGKPMHVKEIAPAMIEAGLWQTTGKTPWKSLWAQMPVDRHGRFIKAGPGIFGLKID